MTWTQKTQMALSIYACNTDHKSAIKQRWGASYGFSQQSGIGYVIPCSKITVRCCNSRVGIILLTWMCVCSHSGESLASLRELLRLPSQLFTAGCLTSWPNVWQYAQHSCWHWCSLNHQLIFFVPFCDTLYVKEPLLWPLDLWSSSDHRLWADLMCINEFWCWHKDPSCVSQFKVHTPVWLRAQARLWIALLSHDGTLGLRVGIREIGGSGLLRWISHDWVLLTLRGWTPRADRQSQQKDRWAGKTNLNGWTGGQRARKGVQKCKVLLQMLKLYILVTRFVVILVV